MPETTKQQADRVRDIVPLQNRQREQEYKARVGDYLATFTSAHGRRVLKDMRKSYCGSNVNPDGTVDIGMVYKREVVKDIEALLVTGKNPKLIEDLFRSPEDDDFDY